LIQKKNIATIQSELSKGELTCIELLAIYIAKIEADKDLNDFVEVYYESATAQAKKIDEKIKSGASLGTLHGVIISIKDNILYKDHSSTAGSKILKGFNSIYSSTAVQRLIEADAIIIGRTNCDEFGMGSTNENSHYGPAKNPLDKSKVPGGSSGGAAVSVAADHCMIALGSDTGGSIRQPAALCGIYGLKPSYGRVSRHGLIAYASSFDQIGILSKYPEDLEIILAVISGPDKFDGTAIPTKWETKSASKAKKKIAYLSNGITEKSLSPEVYETTKKYMEQLEAEGHELVPYEFPYLDFVVPTYYILTTAEASSNLSRFDGIRYGHRSNDASDITSTYKKSRTEGFGKEVKRRIMLGTFVLSSGYYDAYFQKAQKARQLIQSEISSLLAENDFLLLPVCSNQAWDIGKMLNNPVEMYMSDIFTVLANLIGFPAISIPLKVSEESLPIGLQLIAKNEDENNIFEFIKYINISN
jgi:aspartyl-tRNA(Asn)/glutamyl-tRNA(Gln) amidotransferase subunit A